MLATASSNRIGSYIYNPSDMPVLHCLLLPVCARLAAVHLYDTPRRPWPRFFLVLLLPPPCLSRNRTQGFLLLLTVSRYQVHYLSASFVVGKTNSCCHTTSKKKDKATTTASSSRTHPSSTTHLRFKTFQPTSSPFSVS